VPLAWKAVDFLDQLASRLRGTLRVQATPKWMKGLAARVAGHGVVTHVGSAGLRMLAFKTGLTGALSGALAVPGRILVHDRGQVLTDLAVAIADGGTAVRHIRTLRDQGELFGLVASAPTAWRALGEVTPRAREKITVARARVRRQVWQLVAARHGQIPPSATCYGDLGGQIVIRLDATIQIAHSDKEGAAGTHKSTWGLYPLLAWCDNTGELLACLLRPGNAGSNTVTDHIQVLSAALAQVPARYRRKILVTIDGAGSTIELLAHIQALNTPGRQVHYSVGFDLDARVRQAIASLPEPAWAPVLDDAGNARSMDEAGCAEVTGLLRASAGGDKPGNWPPGMRIVVRREKPAAGAKLSDFEKAAGWRYQPVATNTPALALGVQKAEARHRVHARVEDFIRCGKDTGLAHLPFYALAANQVWCDLAALGIDLLAWWRLLALHGSLARAEPATLRYTLLHTAARLVRGQRRRTLKIPEDWPWARQLADALNAILALPNPG
jgi:hypothetical protein